MKIIAENLQEHIFESYHMINEGLLDEFIRNHDINFRKKALYVMLSGMIGLTASTSIINTLSKNSDIDKTIEKIASNIDSNSEDIKQNLLKMADYITNSQEEENRIMAEINKTKTKTKNADNVKRKEPTHMYTLGEISHFNINDADLKPTKKEKIDKEYSRIFNKAIKRKYNASSGGYVNMKDIRVSNSGISHIMDFEQYRNYGYDAEKKGKIVTSGFGTAYLPYKYGEIIPERKLFVYFYGKLEMYEIYVARAIREGARHNKSMLYMPQTAVDALVSLVYNIGPGNFEKSKVGKAIKAGNMDKAAKYILTTNIDMAGHVNRRKSEQELFKRGLKGNKWEKPNNEEEKALITYNSKYI